MAPQQKQQNYLERGENEDLVLKELWGFLVGEHALEGSGLDRDPKEQNDGWLVQDERQSVEEEQQLLAEVADDLGGSEMEAR